MMMIITIKKLISLEEDEKILDFFETDVKLYGDLVFDIDDLDQEYHKIEDLPRSFFTITEKEISYRETHIFTNKRYITIGINFWQLYDPNCKKNLDKIEVENFILSIKREFLQTIKFDLNRDDNIIILGDMVKITSFSKEKYDQLKKFLVDQWNFPQSDIDLKEKAIVYEKAKLIHILCLGEIFVALIVILANSLLLIYIDERSSIYLLSVIISSIVIILSIIEMLLLRSEHNIYKYLMPSQNRFLLYIKSNIFYFLLLWILLS